MTAEGTAPSIAEKVISDMTHEAMAEAIPEATAVVAWDIARIMVRNITSVMTKTVVAPLFVLAHGFAMPEPSLSP